MLYKQPVVGQKIRLVRPYDFDPQGCVPVGATGTVVESSRKEIAIKLDNPPTDLDGDIISFYPECGPLVFNECKIDSIALQFHMTCNYIA